MLDRVEKEKETHPGLKRHIDFTYVGLTDQVATEVHDDPSSATPTARDVTKSYGYDAFGLRLSLTNAPAMVQSPSAVGKQGTFTYAYDVHGSVSALLDEAGNVEATYGYDAYGGADPQLTTGDNDPLLQLNAYRYTGKRTDVGSATIDMGARRFSSDSARFLQPDVYGGVLSNLGLSMDPLTGNRYALAAGNPVSFVEVDGHMLAKAPGGGGVPPAGPPTPKRIQEQQENDPTGFYARTGITAPDKGKVRVEMIIRERLAPARESMGFDETLDWMGLSPGFGDAIDLGHGVTYLVRGRWGDAALAGTAAIPIFGSPGTNAVKYGDEVAGALKSSDEILDVYQSTRFRSFNRGNFRTNLSRLTGKAPSGSHAHHVFPHKFKDRFSELGIDVNNPLFGSWWEAGPHLKAAKEYNDEWNDFLLAPRSPGEVIEFGETLAKDYGLDIMF